MTRALSTLLLSLLASPAWAGTLQGTPVQPTSRTQGSKLSIEISCTVDGACTIFENNQAVGLSEVSAETARDVQSGKLRLTLRRRTRR